MEALKSIFDMPFVKEHGALGVALVVMTLFALLLIGVIWLVFFRLIPAERKAHTESTKADREANNQRAADDRKLFHDVVTEQLNTFKQVHEENVRTAAARHEEARGWHGEVMGGLDDIKGRLRDKRGGDHAQNH